MANYDNEKKFALFKNDKGDNPARPDYRGELTCDGKVYRVSGWIAESKKDGSKYIRGSIELDPKKNGGEQLAVKSGYTPAPQTKTTVHMKQPETDVDF